MASSFLKKGLAYIGLVDDDYDGYDDFEPRSKSAVGRVARPQGVEGGPEVAPAPVGPGSRIRGVPRDEDPSGSTMASISPPPPTVRSSNSPSVRPIAQDSGSARVYIVAPGRFGDAKDIADRLMANQPVIVNMQNAERDLLRRMIDFCSGVTYALSGGMERVAEDVFLLTPSNVKVSDEERQRLADRGLVST